MHKILILLLAQWISLSALAQNIYVVPLQPGTATGNVAYKWIAAGTAGSAQTTGISKPDANFPLFRISTTPPANAEELYVYDSTDLTNWNVAEYVNDRTGYSLAGSQHVIVDSGTITTYTGNTPQTGDAYARIGAAGAGLTALGDTRIANLDAAVSTRLATSGYTVPPTAAANADAIWDEVLSGHLTSGTTGAALNGASGAGDPWATALPGSYGAGTAGYIVGHNINATITSRTAWDDLLDDHTIPGTFGYELQVSLTVADLFTVNSGKTFADAVPGSLIYEIAHHVSDTSGTTTMLSLLENVGGYRFTTHALMQGGGGGGGTDSLLNVLPGSYTGNQAGHVIWKIYNKP